MELFGTAKALFFFFFSFIINFSVWQVTDSSNMILSLYLERTITR